MAVLARVDDIEGARLASGLDDVFALVAGRFFRREVRLRARACLAALAGDDSQLVTSANEIRRMFTALCGPPPNHQHARHWSRWRHRHQERARHRHYQRQRLQDH